MKGFENDSLNKQKSGYLFFDKNFSATLPAIQIITMVLTASTRSADGLIDSCEYEFNNMVTEINMNPINAITRLIEVSPPVNISLIKFFM
jgi:hypothetical protein